MIKNPNFVFDIHKSNIVDSCLSVVAQTFMDSCGTSGPKLSKDSSISKLLYAKDIPTYKERVCKYYQHIKDMQTISDEEMSAILDEESQLRQSEFNTNCALYELYTYVCKYNNQLKETMIGDKTAQIEFLPFRLQEVHRIMKG
uniref:Plexin-A1 n=2 Tax=Cacopsylla melanoneura TaxID=428564 RepID=A0A8D9AZZ3_9HEMI